MQETQGRGGNAIIGLRFDSGDLGAGFAQVCAYGTAAIVEKIDPDRPPAGQMEESS